MIEDIIARLERATGPDRELSDKPTEGEDSALTQGNKPDQ